jgi:hypothetical protein
MSDGASFWDALGAQFDSLSEGRRIRLVGVLGRTARPFVSKFV